MSPKGNPGSEVVMHWSDAAWWAWVPMMLTMIAFWGLIAWLVVRAFLTPAAEDPSPGATVRAILDARLARGEVTREEYLDLRRVLDSEHGDVEAERIGGVR
jgi:uncharacterized membrane protein